MFVDVVVAFGCSCSPRGKMGRKGLWKLCIVFYIKKKEKKKTTTTAKCMCGLIKTNLSYEWWLLYTYIYI